MPPNLNIPLIGLCCLLLYLVARRLFKARPLAYIQGPPSSSFVFGRSYTRIASWGESSDQSLTGNNVDLQHQDDAGELEYNWIAQYGEACKISGSFGVRFMGATSPPSFLPLNFLQQDILMLADPKALHHIVQISSYRYPKPHDTNQAIRLMMGRGIFWASGMWPPPQALRGASNLFLNRR